MIECGVNLLEKEKAEQQRPVKNQQNMMKNKTDEAVITDKRKSSKSKSGKSKKRQK